MDKLKKIVVANWENLEKETKENIEAVWVVVSDTAGSYEVDEEWIGVKQNGDVIYAYASGCSCWDGDYSVTPVDSKTIKTFKFEHQEMEKGWKDAVEKFIETKKTVWL